MITHYYLLLKCKGPLKNASKQCFCVPYQHPVILLHWSLVTGFIQTSCITNYYKVNNCQNKI